MIQNREDFLSEKRRFESYKVCFIVTPTYKIDYQFETLVFCERNSYKLGEAKCLPYLREAGDECRSYITDYNLLIRRNM